MTFKSLIHSRAVFGTFITIPSADIVESLAGIGLDFIIIDTEHTPVNIETLPHLLRAADIARLPAIVRVGEIDERTIYQALDLGATGVQIPQVRRADTLDPLRRATKYSIPGYRGLAPLRGNQYGSKMSRKDLNALDESVVRIVQIETSEAINDLQAISQLDCVDVVFAGPLDLSVALRCPGETSNEKVRDVISQIHASGSAAGKATGVAADDWESAKVFAEQGFKYIAVGSDRSLLSNAIAEGVANLKN